MKMLFGFCIIWGSLSLECSLPSEKQKASRLNVQGINITKVIVNSRGKVLIEGSNIILTIDNQPKIAEIALFCSERLKEKRWTDEFDGKKIAPRPAVAIVFYDRDEPKYNFGIGKHFFSTVDDSGYIWTTATSDEVQRCLDLVGVSSKFLDEL